MSLYPDVQRKAQAELERVVGPNRLPDFGDRDDLVYIQAITLEAMRWMVVVPLGVFHRVISDDEYRGFIIPKGTTVIPVSDTSTSISETGSFSNSSQNAWYITFSFESNISLDKVVRLGPCYMIPRTIPSRRFSSQSDTSRTAS